MTQQSVEIACAISAIYGVDGLLSFTSLHSFGLGFRRHSCR